MFKLIEKYAKISGISGDEKALRDVIIEDIKDYVDEYNVDPNGNLIVFKKGKNRARVKLMLDAHMDEIGLIVIGATDDGYLRFEKVGGIDNRVLFGKRVRIGNINGVIGGCAIHLLEGDERKKVQPCDNLFIDICAKNKREALEFVNIGDSVTFDSGYEEMGEKIAARALDDRFGCAVLVKLIQSELMYDSYFTFTVQEEVGCRGAQTAAYTVDPEVAIAIEATTASDIAGVPNDKKVCIQGNGAVVSFMDNGTVYDKILYNSALKLGKENSIKVQPKSAVAGSNNSAAIHKSRGGVRTLAVCLPCRYIHSAICVADKNDAESVLALVKLMSEKIASGKI